MASGRETAAAEHGTFNMDDPKTRCSRKRRRCADDDYGETRRRWKKMASDARGSSCVRTVGATSGDKYLIIKTGGEWGVREYRV